MHLKITLQLALESVPKAHIDIDRSLFQSLPQGSRGAGMSDVITAAPGIAADSNGMFHPQGEHADTGYVFDNQPITDQQSKQFSNQMPLDIVQSFEVIPAQRRPNTETRRAW